MANRRRQPFRRVVVLVALLGLVWVAPRPVAAFDADAGERTCFNPSGRVMLTFDDAADAARSHAILDILRDRGVRAGFFVLGSWARSNPGVMQRIRAEGHWLGNHTDSHPRLARLSDAAVRREIAGGVESDLLRPPYASFDGRVRSIAASMGYRMCLWTVDSSDYRSRSAAEIQATVFRDLRPGGVVLLHLHGRNTVAALPGLIDGIRARGLQLDELLRHRAAAVDPATAAAVRVRADGEVRTTDPRAYFGSAAGAVQGDVAAVAVPPRGGGYWIADRRGGIFAFGNVGFFGSASHLALHRPIVGMASTPAGDGYWIVASDGGVFAFGNAAFHGSAGDLRLSRPVVTMMPTPTARGYWLVTSDGGVFSFGDALFHGSTGDIDLRSPVVSAAATPRGDGYWLLARDGGVFAFGAARFLGAPAATSTHAPGHFLAIAGDGAGGYRVVEDGDGRPLAFG